VVFLKVLMPGLLSAQPCMHAGAVTPLTCAQVCSRPPQVQQWLQSSLHPVQQLLPPHHTLPADH
jgi:hypothetical protein